MIKFVFFFYHTILTCGNVLSREKKSFLWVKNRTTKTHMHLCVTFKNKLILKIYIISIKEILHEYYYRHHKFIRMHSNSLKFDLIISWALVLTLMIKPFSACDHWFVVCLVYYDLTHTEIWKGCEWPGGWGRGYKREWWRGT